MPIRAYLRDGAFGPEEVAAMSAALEEVCRSLNLPATAVDQRHTIAERIIELARQGEHNSAQLRDRLLKESGSRA